MDLRDFYESILGLKEEGRKSPTLEQVIGGTLATAGLISAVSNMFHMPKPESNSYALGAVSRMEQAGNEAEKELSSNFDTMKNQELARQESGEIARGLTPDATAKSNLANNIGVAYGNALLALKKAKINATNSVTNALANYQSNIAQLQLDSELRKYKAQLGIWGALGGLGTGLISMGNKDNPSLNPTSTTNQNDNVNINGYSGQTNTDILKRMASDNPTSFRNVYYPDFMNEIKRRK